MNDRDLEAILEAAAAHGATSAGWAILRLPREVAPLFRAWLDAHYPLRAAHVMSLVNQNRGGRDNDPRFGARMRGSGEFAELPRRLAGIASHILGTEVLPELGKLAPWLGGAIAIMIGLLILRSLLPLRRSVVWLAVGGLLIAGPWWVYQAVRWGSPLGPRVSQNVPLLGGDAMLERLDDTTGRNWTMLWPAAGSGLDWLRCWGCWCWH